jgi:hypothetical protein
MIRYRSACAQHKHKIESYVFAKLDHDSIQVVEWASVCYAKLPYLQKSGGGGGGGNNNNSGASNLWFCYFKSMLKSANAILNDLFEEHQMMTLNKVDLTEEEETRANQESVESSFESKSDRIFAKMSRDNNNNNSLEAYYQKSLKRYRACLACMSSLFRPLDTEQVVLRVKSSQIVALLRRLFTFDLAKLAASKHDARLNPEVARALTRIMSELLVATLHFACDFFEAVETDLLPYGSVISCMLVSFGYHVKDFSGGAAETAYYQCLRCWMEAAGPSGGLFKYATSVVDALMAAIKPCRNNLVSIESKNRSDKSKASSIFDKAAYQPINDHQIESRNQRITSALKCLQMFIKTFSYKMTYSQFDTIQQTLVDSLLAIQHNNGAHKPYDQIECRLSLYESLFKLCLTQNSKIAAPLSISIGIFRNALDDNSSVIKSYASQCLDALRSFVCPSVPIYFKEYAQVASNQENNDNIRLFSQSQVQIQSQIQSQSQQEQEQTTAFSVFLQSNNPPPPPPPPPAETCSLKLPTRPDDHENSNGQIGQSKPLKRKLSPNLMNSTETPLISGSNKVSNKRALFSSHNGGNENSNGHEDEEDDEDYEEDEEDEEEEEEGEEDVLELDDDDEYDDDDDEDDDEEDDEINEMMLQEDTKPKTTSSLVKKYNHHHGDIISDDDDDEIEEINDERSTTQVFKSLSSLSSSSSSSSLISDTTKQIEDQSTNNTENVVTSTDTLVQDKEGKEEPKDVDQTSVGDTTTTTTTTTTTVEISGNNNNIDQCTIDETQLDLKLDATGVELPLKEAEQSILDLDESLVKSVVVVFTDCGEQRVGNFEQELKEALKLEEALLLNKSDQQQESLLLLPPPPNGDSKLQEMCSTFNAQATLQ